jgi:NAD(P)-dependent dehydrogenase (short-subunit alcohol dehydrogenase family)
VWLENIAHIPVVLVKYACLQFQWLSPLARGHDSSALADALRVESRAEVVHRKFYLDACVVRGTQLKKVLFVTDRIQELFSMRGRRVMVTGASSGLGRHFARLMASAGADLALVARRESVLEELAAELRVHGGEVFVTAMDVADRDSVDAGVAAIYAAGASIDVLINNAGVTVTESFASQSDASWDRVIGTNLTGARNVAQRIVQRMIEAKSGGNIINLASVMSFRVAGYLAAYTASKGAIVQMTRTMALELARNEIRVNAIAPGYIATEFNDEFFESGAGDPIIARIPQRRLGHVEDLDGPMLLLASGASGFMTGSTLVVDGGHLQSTL